MITHFLWNNYNSSDFIHLFDTVGLHALQEIILQTWGQKNLWQKNYIWHFAQKVVVTLFSSGNKDHTPWPPNSKEVFHTCKPLFSVSSKTAGVLCSALTLARLKQNPGWRCMTDFLFQKDWLGFQIYWEILRKHWCKEWPGRKPCVCNVHFIHGKALSDLFVITTLLCGIKDKDGDFNQ